MKFLIELFASISSLFFSQTNKPDNNIVSPLNTAIISFQNTYYTPAVADPDNFPKAKSVVLAIQDTKVETKPVIKNSSPPVVVPLPTLPTPPLPTSPPPPPPPAPIVNTGDPYILQNTAFIDQSIQWLKMDFSLNGSIYDGERSLSNIKIDREYWKVDVFTYWAPGVQPPRPPLEKDYFKLEIYDDENNKLIYTMTSGNDENIHKSQIFKKAGKYTFKASSKTNGQYEVNFLVSPTMAK